MLLRFFGGMYCLLGVIGLLQATGAQAAGNDTGWRVRSNSLRDSGFSKPIVLDQKKREQHFYFPIAQNVRLKDAYLELDATYLRQFASTDGLTIQVNGVSVKVLSLAQGAAPSFLRMTGMDGQSWSADVAAQTKAEINLSIPLKNLDPAARFVDVGVSFNSKIEVDRCAEIIGRGNEVLLDPGTRIRYRYDPNSVADVRSFLTTLPPHPQILLPGQLTGMQYEAALRLLMGLRNQGLDPQLARLPKLGDEVSVEGFNLKGAIASNPLFRSVAVAASQQRPLHVENEMDVAAWLALRLMAEDGLADVVIDAAGIRSALVKAGQIWRDQGILPLMPAWLRQAVAEQWQIKSRSNQANLSVVNWAGTQLLLLDGDNLNPAALLAGSSWSAIANGEALGVGQAIPLSVDAHSHRLMIAHNLPVQYLYGSMHWEVPFGAKDLPSGERPNSIQLNIIAANKNADSAEVVSVFMNDNLITAKRLRTDGEVTSVDAFVPLYSLKANNVVRIEVADPALQGCARSQPLPIQILPSSYLGLTGARDAKEFFALVPALAHEGSVIVPSAYFLHPEDTLLTVSRILQGMQMSPGGFRLQGIDGAEFSVTGPFVSFEVSPKGLRSLVDAQMDRLTIRNKNDLVVFDSRGLGSLAVAQVVGEQGVLVSHIGKGNLSLQAPLELSAGNLAVMDNQGVKLALNTNDPEQEWSLNESGRGVRYFLERYHLPFVVFGLVIGLALLLLAIRSWLKARHTKAG